MHYLFYAYTKWFFFSGAMNNTEEVGCDSETVVYQVVYTYHVLIDCVINIFNIPSQKSIIWSEIE